MNAILAVAFAVLLTASVARADSYSDSNGTLYYPDGSVITSVIYVQSTFQNFDDGYTQIFFQFPNGTGQANNYSQFGIEDNGWINFTAPVENLTVTWNGVWLYANGPNYCFVASCTISIPGPISFVDWTTQTYDSNNGESYQSEGGGGIESMSYTVDTAEPALSSLLLLGLGLVGFTGLYRRKASRRFVSEPGINSATKSSPSQS